VCFQDWLDFVGFQVRSKKCAPQVSILKRTGKASGYVLKLQETESSRVCFCASTATMDIGTTTNGSSSCLFWGGHTCRIVMRWQSSTYEEDTYEEEDTYVRVDTYEEEDTYEADCNTLAE